MFESSAASLTVLELQAIGGVVLDDLLQILEHCGPALQKLVLRSCRYVRAFWFLKSAGRSVSHIKASCMCSWSLASTDERLHGSLL